MPIIKPLFKLPADALKDAENELGIAGIPDTEHFSVSNDTTMEHIRKALVAAYMSGLKEGQKGYCSTGAIARIDALVHSYNNRKAIVTDELGNVIGMQV
jgi:hypothetical protein